MEQWLFLLRVNIDELDVEVQKEIYRSFYKYVYKDIFFIIREHAATEDIIQESFLKAITQGPKTTHASNLASWVRQIARNTALDWLRKYKKKRQEIDAESVNIIEQETAVSKEVENKLRNEMLHLAIQELTPEHRTLLIMFYLEDKSYNEICSELRLSKQVVTQRMARARRKLQQHFSRKWNDRDE
ncbi:RNA polymerase sigma factor [Paenibacillus sp. 32O-W]|uniref:RNA polymerase sigma factor n=1 Tax=Paenibacillus sp. 32O-W TaxID=1695218 RepID=UPI000785B2B3|nr:sigma-70 family RNA polymerase sigma factor [Paenibacillus sp. 32O-W]